MLVTVVIVVICLVESVSSDSSENCKLLCNAYLISIETCTVVTTSDGLIPGDVVLSQNTSAFGFPLNLTGSAQQEVKSFGACIRYPSTLIYQNGVKFRVPYLLADSAALPLRMTWYYSNDISKSVSELIEMESDSSESGEDGVVSGTSEGTLPPSTEDNAVCFILETENAIAVTEDIANVINLGTLEVEPSDEDECDE